MRASDVSAVARWSDSVEPAINRLHPLTQCKTDLNFHTRSEKKHM